ncbi:Esterase C25G4.2 [Caenorhabditis elegans]|uniref:Esterase C25G4.2 n=1 Tax=Caenorhabditis elegans TaxID=6239 RepID=LOVG_CAEEL|nr:Esterase C25G4.2 [Caenorhabditis elegans]Q18169.1 RecName: Full=Esterase C25G4.2 [Caenorhabditis elegans]CAA94571.1 Esterase C25G4.2 [Caenorhabditis elegans]|eukprot:NP_502376.1 Esterase C25G4.2 [Caenorhabditis elegans]
MSSQPKLRILCLHGYRQCDQSFRQKTGSTRKLVKSLAEFEFVNGVHSVAVDEHVDSSRAWWFSNNEAMSFSSRESTEVAVGFEESVAAVVKFIEENGPFDGLLGFSQGASMVHLLIAKAQLGEIKLPGIRFAIFFSGFLSLSSKHDSLTLLRIKEFPSMHVFGDADEIVARPKSEKMADMFDVEPLRIAHDGGHVVPSMSKHKEKIAGFMREQLDRKIENN